MSEKYTYCVIILQQSNRDLKQNSRKRRRQRRQGNKTEIMLTFVPSCSHMRRQFLHFHVVCKTWSIFSFRKRCLKQQHTHKHRYYYKLLQSLYMDMISSRIYFHGETGLNVSYLKAVVKKRKRGIHSIFRQDSKLNNESTVSVSTNGLLICNSHKT